MGVPQMTQTPGQEEYATNLYNYPPQPISSSTTNSSSILSEYLLHGLTNTFLQKYSRELTIAASSLSVLIVLIIGACICCIIRALHKDVDNDSDNTSTASTRRGVYQASKGAKQYSQSEDVESSGCRSDGSVTPTSGSKWTSKEGRKGFPLISKLFSKHNGSSARILAQHRNIITPDKTIPFVVPTVSLPAQPSETFSNGVSSASTPQLEPRPSTSRGASAGGSQQKGLLSAQQFFPQLENPEVDSCPLIAFSLFYELSSQILNVRLLEGRNFPESVNHTVAVKIYPGRGGKQQTREFKGRSPVYNIEFCYHVRKTSLFTKILKLRAVIPGNPKRVIGYVNMAVKDLPGFSTGEEEISQDLKTSLLWRRVELPSETGGGVKLQVSLKWCAEPSPGLLTLRIIEASGLHENRECDYTSSYVKVTLQEQGRNIKTRKTQLVRWGSVPLYDDMFVLTIPKELLAHISFLLVVIARGRLGSKAVLGKIRIGPVACVTSSSGGGEGGGTPSGTELWEDMCHQPDSEIMRWLHLVP